ncbi:MAG TPA: septum formation inhibitor Maf [Arcobacter sp.]|nr:septum formation inhibitor Maf [Arcobacter sp.]HIP56131.1 septum formation inhibitor Maf [Arcobacter sp.]
MIRLGSNSATRAGILKAHNIEFVQNGGNYDEDSISTKNPKEFVIKATMGKYEELIKKYGYEDMPLLVCDTVVTCEGKLLRKAKDKADARYMLELQSNNETSIITCMIFKSKETYVYDVSTTTYTFDKFQKEDLDEYINTGLCMGKAGAIMVEGFCKPYIKKVNGFESTAMGLCIEKLIPFL